MAERRMFAKTIIDSDAFLDMPLSAQALYFHLSMRADDEGFVGNPKRIRGMIGASEDDLKLLILKRFLLAFDSGVVVVKHWKIHNYIQSDRYKETTYLEERATLTLDGKKAYTECIQVGDEMYTQDSIGKSKDSLDKDRVEEGGQAALPPPSTRFVKPTIEEVKAYCEERGNKFEPQKFFNYYESVGWKRGKTPIKDWKACVRTWEKEEKSTTSGSAKPSKYDREE